MWLPSARLSEKESLPIVRVQYVLLFDTSDAYEKPLTGQSLAQTSLLTPPTYWAMMHLLKRSPCSTLADQ
eukprot:scaffold503_cov375-Pinguiococcus_pyrenoidosus.AAC.27